MCWLSLVRTDIELLTRYINSDVVTANDHTETGVFHLPLGPPVELERSRGESFTKLKECSYNVQTLQYIYELVIT